MKRAGRWLFNFAAVVSLVFLVAAVVAWPLSYRRGVTVQRISPGSSANLSIGSGRISVVFLVYAQPGQKTLYHWSEWSAGSPQSAFKRVLGVIPAPGRADEDKVLPRIEDLHHFYVPFWVVPLILSWPIIPLAWRHWRTPLPPDHCKHCGYDLRATPDRCPECGTIPKNAKGAAT